MREGSKGAPRGVLSRTDRCQPSGPPYGGPTGWRQGERRGSMRDAPTLTHTHAAPHAALSHARATHSSRPSRP
eukprot:2774479-Prymnesium_polylepis.1